MFVGARPDLISSPDNWRHRDYKQMGYLFRNLTTASVRECTCSFP